LYSTDWVLMAAQAQFCPITVSTINRMQGNTFIAIDLQKTFISRYFGRFLVGRLMEYISGCGARQGGFTTNSFADYYLI
jgi:hypothetical protein